MAARASCQPRPPLSYHNVTEGECMVRTGIAHHHSEHLGAYTWDYWDARIKEAL